MMADACKFRTAVANSYVAPSVHSVLLCVCKIFSTLFHRADQVGPDMSWEDLEMGSENYSDSKVFIIFREFFGEPFYDGNCW